MTKMGWLGLVRVTKRTGGCTAPKCQHSTDAKSRIQDKSGNKEQTLFTNNPTFRHILFHWLRPAVSTMRRSCVRIFVRSSVCLSIPSFFKR